MSELPTGRPAAAAVTVAAAAAAAAAAAVSMSVPGSADASANQVRTICPFAVWEALGFEMETDIDIEDTAPFQYQDVLFRATGDGWWISVDGIGGRGAAPDSRQAVLEFVIAARSTWLQIERAFDEIAAVITAARALLGSGARIALTDLLRSAPGTITSRPRALVSAARGEAAFRLAPQATMGVPLDRLLEMLIAGRDFRLVEHQRARLAADVHRLIRNHGDEPSATILASCLDGRWSGRTSGEQETRIATVQELSGEAVRKVLAQDPERIPRLHARLLRDPDRLVPHQGELLGRGECTDGIDVATAWLARVSAPLPSGVALSDLRKAAGLIAMILRYLNEGWFQLGSAPYAKSAFTVMMRTSFAAMFRNLGTAQALFRRDIGTVLDTWAGDRLNPAWRVFREGYKDDGLKALAMQGVRAGSVQDLRFGGRIRRAGTDAASTVVTFHGPRIVDWIESILNPRHDPEDFRQVDRFLADVCPPGYATFVAAEALARKDLMSRGPVVYSSTSIGLFDVKDIGGAAFVVLELRQWPSESIEVADCKQLFRRIAGFFATCCGATVGISLTPVNIGSLFGSLGAGGLGAALLRLKRSGARSSGTPGDCLFDAALASGSYPGQTAASLRTRVAAEVRTNWRRYVDFLANGAGDDVMADINAAAEYLAQPGNWQQDVADLAPLALAHATNTILRINNTSTAATANVGPAAGPVVNLSYNGVDHYTPGGGAAAAATAAAAAPPPTASSAVVTGDVRAV